MDTNNLFTLENPPQLASQLVSWFVAHARPLPWRKKRDPYSIWVSEVMLQQTTVKAVVPFFSNFMTRFPNLERLANASVPEVLEAWTGLGYYSRAHRLREAAVTLHARGCFPQTAEELQKLPGFGPYTARAVASLAFGEPVGVVDGNVARVLTRLLAYQGEWWRSQAMRSLQALADQLAAVGDPYLLNQALMELGATVCTPNKPVCGLCPWAKNCRARSLELISSVPKKRARPEKETLLWSPLIVRRHGRLALTTNSYAPFLKNQWLLPGKVRHLKSAPKNYAFKHSITRFEIYVQPKTAAPNDLPEGLDLCWVRTDEIPRKNPSSLIKKTLVHHKSS